MFYNILKLDCKEESIRLSKVFEVYEYMFQLDEFPDTEDKRNENE